MQSPGFPKIVYCVCTFQPGNFIGWGSEVVDGERKRGSKAGPVDENCISNTHTQPAPLHSRVAPVCKDKTRHLKVVKTLPFCDQQSVSITS